MAEELLQTGLLPLDKELNGGLFMGSLVYIKADAMAMAEIFLYHFIQQRKTYYVNTERKPEYIMNNMNHIGFDTSGITFIDVHQKYFKKECSNPMPEMLRNYKIIDFFKKQLDTIEDTKVNLIIDTITFFLTMEVKKIFLNEMIDSIYNNTKKMRGLGFLYGLKGSGDTLIENELINLCDVVFDVSMIKKSDKTITELIIPKARDRPIFGNILRFRIEGGVIMDTSKEIA
ncbi:MAG: recombinase RecA [Candidatus Methanoperedens sp.]|nr:recombinase RecA [Candidatus Methanoperedens sp.]MCE8426885.1 recombinase RecA [Candidatus Methanoperedens sp.]